MKPLQNTKFVTEGNLTGETIDFGFDQNSLAHLQSVLSDLYARPKEAVLRELAVNAFDAHVAIGQTRPIEVTLPSQFNATLKVQDFGVGMSVDDLYRVYTKYGASTKRDGNDQVGMLGVGSKSPLAVSNTFTIVTIHDGVKVTASVTKNEQGIGRLMIVDTRATTEHSGTTITVPMDNVGVGVARALFAYWDAGTVLVNGKPPEQFRNVVRINDNLFLVNDDSVGADRVVMGNIAYPVTDNTILTGLRNSYGYYGRWHIVRTVPIGSVQFAPSREDLNWSKATKQYLASIRDEADKAIQESMTNEITSAVSLMDAWKARNKWNNIGLRLTFPRWNGIDFPRNFSGNFTMMDYRDVYGRNGGQSKRWRTEYNYRYVSPEALIDKKVLWLEGGTCETITQTFKKKLTQYIEGTDFKTVIIINSWLDDDGWLDDVDLVDIDRIKKIKLIKPATPKKERQELSYTLTTKDGNEEQTTPYTDDPFYVTVEETMVPLWNLVSAEVVYVPKNRLAKFLRLYPNARSGLEWLVNKAKTFNFTKDDQLDLMSLPSVLEGIDPDKLEDKELAKVIKRIRTNKYTMPAKVTWAIQVINAADNMGYRLTIDNLPTREMLDVSKKYPLTRGLYVHNRTQREHLIVYMNAVHLLDPTVHYC